MSTVINDSVVAMCAKRGLPTSAILAGALESIPFGLGSRIGEADPPGAPPSVFLPSPHYPERARPPTDDPLGVMPVVVGMSSGEIAGEEKALAPPIHFGGDGAAGPDPADPGLSGDHVLDRRVPQTTGFAGDSPGAGGATHSQTMFPYAVVNTGPPYAAGAAGSHGPGRDGPAPPRGRRDHVPGIARGIAPLHRLLHRVVACSSRFAVAPGEACLLVAEDSGCEGMIR